MEEEYKLGEFVLYRTKAGRTYEVQVVGKKPWTVGGCYRTNYLLMDFNDSLNKDELIGRWFHHVQGPGTWRDQGATIIVPMIDSDKSYFWTSNCEEYGSSIERDSFSSELEKIKEEVGL